MKRKQHLGWPKIGQFRDVIRRVSEINGYIGRDEKGEPIYATVSTKPTITFRGTVKLHGTNAAVCYNNEDGLYCQSRNKVVSMGHFDFPHFVNTHAEAFETKLKQLAVANNINLDTHLIGIYGEWCGKGVQNTTAINELEKNFYIFGIRSAPIVRDSDEHRGQATDYNAAPTKFDFCHNIYDFPIYHLDIDFNNPALAQKKLIEITEAVEAECPVANQLGIKGMGEGVVWNAEFKGETIRFKVKGAKHSVSKVKTLAPIDLEKLAKAAEFADYAVTMNRVKQAIQEIEADNLTKALTGKIIQWVKNDVAKEEVLALNENGFTFGDVQREVGNRARILFFELLDQV